MAHESSDGEITKMSRLTGEMMLLSNNNKVSDRLTDLLRQPGLEDRRAIIEFCLTSTITDEMTSRHLTFGQLRDMVILSGQRLRNLLEDLTFYNEMTKCQRNQNRERLQEMQQKTFAAIYLSKGVNRIIIQLACMHLQLPFIPLDQNLPTDRIQSICTDQTPIAYIYDNILKEHKHIFEKEVKKRPNNAVLINASNLCIWQETVTEKDIICLPLFSHIPNPVILELFTSGSTSMSPKSVLLSNTQLTNRLLWQWQETSPMSDLVGPSLVKTSWLFVDAFTELFGSLLAGRTVVVSSGGKEDVSIEHLVTDVKLLAEVVRKFKIEQITTVPSQLEAWLMQFRTVSADDFTSLRVLVLSGEVLPPRLAYRAFELLAQKKPLRLVNLYGSTEIAGDVTAAVFESPDKLDELIFKGEKERKVLPIGQPIINTEIYIATDENEAGQLSLVPQGTTGEICVSGASITNSCTAPYIEVNNFRSSSSPFGHLFRTGDTGFICPKSGQLYVIGRQDDVVKVNGVKFNAQNIDNFFQTIGTSTFPGLLATVTLPISKSDTQTLLVCFFVRDKMAESFTADHLAASVKARFAFVNIICVEVDEIPTQKHSGKIDRIRLKDAYFCKKNTLKVIKKDSEDNHVEESALLSWREEIRQIIAVYLSLGVGKQISGRPRDEEDFYNLGGDSLMAAVIVSDLRQRGFNASIVDFIQHRKIGQLLDIIYDLSPNPYAGHSVEITSSTHNALRFTWQGTTGTFIFEWSPGKTFSGNLELDRLCRKRIIEIVVNSFVSSDLLCTSIRATKSMLRQITESRLKQHEELGGLVLLAGFAPNCQELDDTHSLLSKVEAAHICVPANASIPDIDEPVYQIIEEFFSSMVSENDVEEECISDRIPLLSFMLGVQPGAQRLHKGNYRQNNIRYMLALEKETIARAIKMGFPSIETVNISPLSTQIGFELGYEVISKADFIPFAKERGLQCFSHELVCYLMRKNLQVAGKSVSVPTIPQKLFQGT